MAAISEAIDIAQTPEVWLMSLVIALSKEVFDRLVIRIENQRQMLQELETILVPDLSLAVDKAKNSPKRKQLENWLKRLMDAYYKAEEAIDLLVYYQLQRMVEIKYLYPKIVVRLKTGVGFLEHQTITSTKKQITDFLKIAKECINYRDLFQDSDSSHCERETVSELKERVFGRDEAREKILRKLTKGKVREHGPSMVSSSVIAITGQPGVGKTTLAKYIYNYAKQHVLFDIFMWVYVPRKFDASDVICKMIKVKESKILGHVNEQKVQFTFNENFPLEGLRWGSKSKILLTTPSTEAARQIRVPEENIHKLDQLEEEAFLKLLLYHANKPEDSPEAVLQASESDGNILPDNLEALKFQNCENIDFLIERSTLPELHTIRFVFCSIKKINLTNLSKLKQLSILGCSSELEGLSSSELNLLQVWDCPEIRPVDTYKSQLPLVDIDDTSLLRLIQSDKISELVDLEISFTKGGPIDDKVFEKLTSLKCLTFHSCKITSLPPTLKGLATLCTLRLRNCQKLHDLRVLPSNLKMLEIEGCPIVEKQYGRNGPKHEHIAHIPRIVFKCLPNHTTSSLWPTQLDGEEDSLVQRKLLLDQKILQGLDDKSRFLYQYLMNVSPDLKSFKVSNDYFNFTAMETFVVNSEDIIEMIEREMLNISIVKVWSM
ncbi:hypothetical protein LUZ61_002850 [Rhynchospora tenuis]|uniref:NB-ARC domain-containing protein n=1 Tax=Rhynchospora tenuis TaxID=198213 RepID=A0AAD6ESA1_9POAL|nr:hypothetical protein LUZ61_002850 [Rhynchospora tenuis]